MGISQESTQQSFAIFIKRIIQPEKNFYKAAFIYGVAISLLTLAVPLSVQTLIGSVANTALPQSIFAVSLLLFILLTLYSTLNIMQLYALELFERRFFMRVTAQTVQARIYNMQTYEKNVPINRFFEVVHVQKSIPSLVVGGFSLCLQTLVGLLVVSFYHPYLLVFTVTLVLICLMGWRTFHKGALQGAIEVSAEKYAVADWLEHLDQIPDINKRIHEAANCELVNQRYLKAREGFFRYNFAKNLMFMAIYVLANVCLLGLGGLLVIKGQLSIGQLVAAELILSGILYGLSKFGYYLTLYYELSAAALKLDNLLELPPGSQPLETTMPAIASSWQNISVSKPMRITARLATVLIALATASAFIPWVQTAYGTGSVTAMDPGGQLQSIHALVKGRIKQWYVRDGSMVAEGDPILEIVDNDPQLLERLQAEADAAQKGRDVAHTAAQTSLLNFQRQEELHNKGLASRHDMEKAKIEYQTWLAKEADAVAKLTSTQTKLSRQHTQLIRAPKAGLIMRTGAGDLATLVKEGDVIATFVPKDSRRAIELYVTGLDMPLIQPGRKVRLQFEGWPAVQFSGWPSAAIGTFAGEVSVVAPSVSPNNKFRILVTEPEGEPWPDVRYLRFGARANGWVLLETVPLGYELWRKMNAFPPENADLNTQKASASGTEKAGTEKE